ncbi:hypothetical protein C2S51_005523 [Perilla frutescens var. frutescens]|nr:hypothetical protein C2S51_005523 [Perilla frutescens var. frutescens]
MTYCFCLEFAFATDTLRVNESLRDSEFLVSNGQIFKLANRDNPLKDSNGTVEISENGNLVILDGKKGLSTVWESFEHASDSLLQTMKLTTELSIGEKNILTSWKSGSDPVRGSFRASIEPVEIPQIVVRNGSHPYWRSGPWNGQVFIGVFGMERAYRTGFTMVNDDDATRMYITFTYSNTSVLMYVVLTASGVLEQKEWSDEKGYWEVTWSSIANDCDVYGRCGPFGICDSKARPICACMQGFQPKNLDEWNAGNWMSGCIRKIPLQCAGIGNQDGFLRLKTVKLPDHFRWLPTIEADCGNQCLNDCSCVAYTYYPAIGCMLWNETLIDVQKFSSEGGDLYIRLPPSELDNKKKRTVIIAVTVVVAFVMTVISMYFILKWYRVRKQRRAVLLTTTKSHGRDLQHSEKSLLIDNVNGIKLEELPLFKFEVLSDATRNFDSIHKLGQGGFGPVYRGKLANGHEIAVKRLARSSNQGLEEFMNEVEVISKLQHRNLVRLLGCCVEREEKMLVYEYMPCGSLDAYLFDSCKEERLDWKQRVFIIEGICRGLLYLHRDSRLRIIHRDLKASNILLDKEVNPKISDFGMARIFGEKEEQANTSRVVGTLGYMAPEYALQGRFSEKSDVYSFGVLLLEILSGRRNTSFYNDEQAQSLTAYAWKLWSEENIIKLVDPLVYDEQYKVEIMRYVLVGLLCVQETAQDRPSMSAVQSMLSNEIADLPLPKQPGFVVHMRLKSSRRFSVNSLSATILQGR